MRILVILSFLLASFDSQAFTMKFRQQISIWDCPKGAKFLLLECSTEEKEPESVSIQMIEISPAFYVGRFDGVHGQDIPAHGMFSVTYDPAAEVKISALAYLGWNEDYHLNSGLFFQEYDSKFPVIYITGPRIPQQAEGREWVPTFAVDQFSIEE